MTIESRIGPPRLMAARGDPATFFEDTIKKVYYLMTVGILLSNRVSFSITYGCIPIDPGYKTGRSNNT